MSDILASAKAALDLASRLREINKKVANAEFSNVLADLSVELAEMKVELAALIEENAELKRKLAEREETESSSRNSPIFLPPEMGRFVRGAMTTIES